MGCRICGRGSCTESFHSLAEQAAWQSVAGLSEGELRREVIDLRGELADRDAEIARLEAELREPTT